MSRRRAWSWTQLNDFETCPRWYFHKTVAKTLPKEMNAAMRRGIEDHEALERVLKGALRGEAVHLPETLRAAAPVVSSILASVGSAQLKVEPEYAVDWNWRPCSPRAWTDVMIRTKIDVLLLRPPGTLYVDWKTGKFKEVPDQLRLAALIVLAWEPEVDTVVGMDVFTQTGACGTQVRVERKDQAHLREHFEERADGIQTCLQTGNWEPKQNGLCRRYCPVPPEHCGVKRLLS